MMSFHNNSDESVKNQMHDITSDLQMININSNESINNESSSKSVDNGFRGKRKSIMSDVTNLFFKNNNIRASILDTTKTKVQSVSNVKTDLLKRLKIIKGPDHINEHAEASFSEQILYQIENRISSNPSTPFVALGLFFIFLLVIFGFVWHTLTNLNKSKLISNGLFNEDLYGTASIADSFYLSLLTLTSGGYDDSIPEYNGLRILYFAMIFAGMVIFAILVGFITDSIQSFMTSLNEGRSKCCETDHTLILGWNEATIRFVVQVSFLRRQYQKLNEDKFFGILYYFPLLKLVLGPLNLLEAPSTTLACNDIVILTNSKTKEEMHELLSRAFEERGIDPKRTKIGQNVICRVGDPTNVFDLINVSAHKAAAIITMMTHEDDEEEEQSNYKLQNGATMRVALALRHALFTNDFEQATLLTPAVHNNPDLRIILQLSSPSAYIDALSFKNDDGYDVVLPIDLSPFLNSIMFSCSAQPGLAKVILSLLDIEGTCLRRRYAKNLRSGPKKECGACVGSTFLDLSKQFEEATVIGILRLGMMDPEIIRKNGFGLCPDPNIIIEKDDLIIFIGKKMFNKL